MKFYFLACFMLCAEVIAQDVQQLFTKEGLKVNFGHFNKVRKHKVLNAPSLTIKNLELENSINHDLLFVEIVSPIDPGIAQRQLESKYSLIHNQYKGQPTPYQGLITSQSNCPAGVKPKSFQINLAKSQVQALAMKVSEKNIYGECEGNLNYNATFLMYYQKQKKALFLFKTLTSSEKGVSVNKLLEMFKTIEDSN